jgi:hypothetical protein
MDPLITVALLLFGAVVFLWRFYWFRYVCFYVWYLLKGEQDQTKPLPKPRAKPQFLEEEPQEATVALEEELDPEPEVARKSELLPYEEWLHICNNLPDDMPHILVRGGSGSGKTTFTRALLTVRQGKAVVVTPKEEDAELWSLPIVTTDFDGSFETIATTLEELRLVVSHGDHDVYCQQPNTSCLEVANAQDLRGHTHR